MNETTARVLAYYIGLFIVFFSLGWVIADLTSH